MLKISADVNTPRDLWFKINMLEKNVEAHKLAMTLANQAIHTLYDETLFLKDKGIDNE